MVECHDCGKKEATSIVYNKDNGWLKLCDECINSDDVVCPFEVLL